MKKVLFYQNKDTAPVEAEVINENNENNFDLLLPDGTNQLLVLRKDNNNYSELELDRCCYFEDIPSQDKTPNPDAAPAQDESTENIHE